MARYDVHFQPVYPPEDIHGFKAFTFGFTQSIKIRGPQSLVNRWWKTFMTPKGSDLLHPSYGTDFGGLIGSNIVSDFSELQDLVIMSVDDAADQVREQDEDGLLDDDESLESAVLQRFVPQPAGDGFEIWVVLTNKAGQDLTATLALQPTR